jgi:hypothetical protein
MEFWPTFGHVPKLNLLKENQNILDIMFDFLSFNSSYSLNTQKSFKNLDRKELLSSTINVWML